MITCLIKSFKRLIVRFLLNNIDKDFNSSKNGDGKTLIILKTVLNASPQKFNKRFASTRRDNPISTL